MCLRHNEFSSTRNPSIIIHGSDPGRCTCNYFSQHWNLTVWKQKTVWWGRVHQSRCMSCPGESTDSTLNPAWSHQICSMEQTLESNLFALTERRMPGWDKQASTFGNLCCYHVIVEKWTAKTGSCIHSVALTFEAEVHWGSHLSNEEALLGEVVGRDHTIFWQTAC